MMFDENDGCVACALRTTANNANKYRAKVSKNSNRPIDIIPFICFNTMLDESDNWGVFRIVFVACEAD